LQTLKNNAAKLFHLVYILYTLKTFHCTSLEKKITRRARTFFRQKTLHCVYDSDEKRSASRLE